MNPGVGLCLGCVVQLDGVIFAVIIIIKIIVKIIIIIMMMMMIQTWGWTVVGLCGTTACEFAGKKAGKV